MYDTNNTWWSLAMTVPTAMAGLLAVLDQLRTVLGLVALIVGIVGSVLSLINQWRKMKGGHHNGDTG